MHRPLLPLTTLVIYPSTVDKIYIACGAYEKAVKTLK